MAKIKTVYYVNQFFGQEGGEEAASTGIKVYEGALGVAKSFAEAYGDDCEVLATIVCGDNYIAENLDEVTAEIVELVAGYKPDLFAAGPAYAAGRYGVACGSLCQAVGGRLGIPTVTAMNELNPGVALYRKSTYIVSTDANARMVKTDTAKMARLAKKLVNKEHISSPEEEKYFAKGYKRNVRLERRPAKRAVDMLLNKFNGREFITEIPLPPKEDISRPAAIPDLSKATIALATDGGLYPAGNPDNMPSANADRFESYDISSLDTLKEGEWVIKHNGYDNTFSNADPNRLVPVDSMRVLEKEGYIGKLYDEFLATTGLICTVENATKTGKQMVKYIKERDIDAVILTST